MIVRALVFGLAMLSTVPASAQGLPLELTWEAPTECPDAASVRAELERIVVADAGHAPDLLHASGTITHGARGFRLVLETERAGERGRRTLTAARCDDLLDAATLVLALAYGAGVELRADQPVEAVVPMSDGEDEIAGAVEREAESEVEGEAEGLGEGEGQIEGEGAVEGGFEDEIEGDGDVEPGLGTLLVSLGASGGLLSQATFLGSVGGEIGNQYARGRLTIGIAPGATVPIDGDAYAELYDGFVGLEGCAGAPVGIVRGEACAGAVVHGIHARANGLAESGDALAPLVTLRAALDVGVRVDSVELRLVTGIEWATARPRFEVLGLGVVHVVGEISATGAIAIAWSP